LLRHYLLRLPAHGEVQQQDSIVDLENIMREELKEFFSQWERIGKYRPPNRRDS
jgi:hypothetical protein